ncbi:MAG TPA: hypothetical protein VMH80_06125 [Bryobacteraceae bacterium]|nr:hypothetical protein [Bryobacteraceae bacterium]
MKLQELETSEVRNDFASALKKAVEDVPALEIVHKKAEARRAKEEAERQRLLALFASINSKLKAATQELVAAKTRWLGSTIDEAEDSAAHKEYLRLRGRKQDLLDQLSYLANYAQEDNAREILEAHIAERGALADLREAQAARQRLGVIAGAASAMQFDPGGSITFPEDAWSSRAAAEAHDLRSIGVKGLEEQLAKHDAAVAARRDLVAGTLFS